MEAANFYSFSKAQGLKIIILRKFQFLNFQKHQQTVLKIVRVSKKRWILGGIFGSEFSETNIYKTKYPENMHFYLNQVVLTVEKWLWYPFSVMVISINLKS